MFANNDGKFEILAKYKTNGKEYELDAVVDGNKYDLLARQEDIEELVDTEGEVSVKVIDNRPKHLKLDFVNKKYNLNDEEVDFYDIADFKRLSKAWDFDDTGLVEYEIDEPRFKNGLFLEQESTNLHLNSTDPRKWVNFLPDDGVTNIESPNGLKGIKFSPNRALVPYFTLRSNNENITISLLGNREEEISALLLRNNQDNQNYQTKQYEKDKNISCDDWGKYNNLTYASATYTIEKEVMDRGHTYYLGCINSLNNKTILWYAAQVEHSTKRSSFIVSGDEPTTRAKDHLVLNIPKGYTVKGDWDDTLELYEQNGRLQYNGYGVIRTLEVLPITKKYTIDFTQDAIVSNTGFIHKDIFSRGLLEFERLSKAWDFVDGGLKEYDIDEPRLSDRGLLIEPESTTYKRTSLTGSYTLETQGVDFWDNVYRRENTAYIAFLPRSEGRTFSFLSSSGLNLKHEIYFDSTDGYKEANRMFLTEDWVKVWRSSKIENPINVTPHVNGGVQGELLKLFQLESSSDSTSYIVPTGDETTRLSDLLTILTKFNFIIEADDGIKINNKELEGFGYIRKIEVTE